MLWTTLTERERKREKEPGRGYGKENWLREKNHSTHLNEFLKRFNHYHQFWPFEAKFLLLFRSRMIKNRTEISLNLALIPTFIITGTITGLQFSSFCLWAAITITKYTLQNKAAVSKVNTIWQGGWTPAKWSDLNLILQD